MAEDLMEDLYNKYLPTKSSVLNLIDDYSLFCYYMQDDVVINKVILSPIRDKTADKEDTLPSFIIYQGRNGELRYYDHGKGGKGGDIFDFVGELYGLTTTLQIIHKIDYDFQLGLVHNNYDKTDNHTTRKEFLEPKPRKIHMTAEIRDIVSIPFTSAGVNFWKQFNISTDILKEYNVTQISVILTDRGNIYIRKDTLAFAYRIGDKYKIYQPYNPDHKFINNYPSNYVEGYYQLHVRKPSQPVLFITKSLKDVMTLRSLNQDAISPKAENILIPQFILKELELKYKYIVTLFDDDPAGNRASLKYPYPAIKVPIEKSNTGTLIVKDIADYIKQHSPEKAKSLLIKLLTKCN